MGRWWSEHGPREVSSRHHYLVLATPPIPRIIDTPSTHATTPFIFTAPSASGIFYDKTTFRRSGLLLDKLPSNVDHEMPEGVIVDEADPLSSIDVNIFVVNPPHDIVVGINMDTIDYVLDEPFLSALRTFLGRGRIYALLLSYSVEKGWAAHAGIFTGGVMSDGARIALRAYTECLQHHHSRINNPQIRNNADDVAINGCKSSVP